MLENIDCNAMLIKEEYKQIIQALQTKLSFLQQQVKAAGIPVILVFEGWGAAGKGSLIAKLILNLDPRGFQVFSMTEPNETERRYPTMRRYWENTPLYGDFSIFDRSWYQDISVNRLEQDVSRQELARRVEQILTFERQLTDDGAVILKFFLHITRETQKKRFKKLESAPETSWRVTKRDWKRNKDYNAYFQAFDEMLAATSTKNAPWHVVAAHNRRFATATIFQTVVETLEKALAGREELNRAREERKEMGPGIAAAPAVVPPMPETFHLVPMPSLSQVDLNRTLPEEEYQRVLKEEQEKLRLLHGRLYREKVPVVIAYEGWDAAGKGGNIKRVAASLDPRGYNVIPIAAPDKTELHHHYLWRFYKQLPKTGHIAIFDRTWYGRVMVERLEGFCPEGRWEQAYQEINEFERELTDWGAVLLKFWLHIDRDEQLRRFNDRENTPEKRYKITEEDWRNRDKWDLYEVAVNDMLAFTSTDTAPWHIIESNDKRFARIKAIKTIISAIENRLG